MSTVATASGPSPDRPGSPGSLTAAGHGTDGASRDWWERSGLVATAVVAAAWVVVLGLILSRRVFISHDSLSNNVHVWYIAEQFWHGHGIPLHMPVLAGGNAYTFPYASIPWIATALIWPLFGDWSVTFMLVAGLVATVAATFWALPTLRRGWWAAATLTNPALVIAPVLGQLPFLWSIAAFTTAIGLYRRGRIGWAVAMTVIAQVIHPAVTMLIVATVIALWLPFEESGKRLRLLGWWALTVVISLPAAWMVLQSPVVAQTSRLTQIGALFQTAGMRLLVIFLPLLFVFLQWLRIPRIAPVLLTMLFVALQVPMYQPFGMDFAWGALTRDPPASAEAFADGPTMEPNHVYRVLSGHDGKYAMYAVVRAGGTLDAEFFPEALHRGGFGSNERYARFLRDRDVERVVIFPSYSQHYQRSNEAKVLEDMVRAGCVDGEAVRRLESREEWQLYSVSDC